MNWAIYLHRETKEFSWHYKLPNGWEAIVRSQGVGANGMSLYQVVAECNHCVADSKQIVSDLGDAKSLAIALACEQRHCGNAEEDCGEFREIKNRQGQSDKGMLAGR
jgi:hypothetical protein